MWLNNLLEAGKECWLVSNNDLPPYRKLCKWDYKDDEHDAVSLAYYGWLNFDNPSAFLSIRLPELNVIYQKYLEKERINRELVPLVNRSRNLLHTEFPEAKRSKTQKEEIIDGIWLFIADQIPSEIQLNHWQSRLNKSIGTAKNSGFSQELVTNAQRIVDLKIARRQIYREFKEFLAKPDYAFYNDAFDQFKFGIIDRIIMLCQIHPFTQFLDNNLSELKIEKKRKVGKSGKPITKRKGLNRFHARLGKAVKPWSSGEKKGHIITGSTLARNQLYLWVKRNIVMVNHKEPTRLITLLQKRYDMDITESDGFLEFLKTLSEEESESLIDLLKSHRVGKVLVPTVQNAIAKKKNPLSRVKANGQNTLKQWAKARVSDKLVKLLFKELIGCYRKHSR